MIDCTPSPTCTRVQSPCNNGTPLGPPKRKKNVRVRKSIITDELLSGGLNAIKVSSEPKPYKKLNLIDTVTLKVQVNSTPSPKEDENNNTSSSQTCSPYTLAPKYSPPKYSPTNESPLTRSQERNQIFIDENQNFTDMKTSKSLHNLPSTPKQKLDKAFYLQAIRSMKTRSMTQCGKESSGAQNNDMKQIEDLLNSSTVLFEDEDEQME